MEIAFEAELWEHDGPGGWHFVTVPMPLTEDVRERAGEQARGFGSLRVRATVGATTWQTSVFPGREGYVLPVKKPVRRTEDLLAGDLVPVTLVLVDL